MSNSSAFHNNDNKNRPTISHPYTPHNNSTSNRLNQSKYSYNNSHLNQSHSHDQSDYEIVVEF